MKDKYTAKIDSYGNKYYYKNGKLHRDNGLPAFECVNREKEYWINGRQLTKEEVKKLNVKWVKVKR